MTDPAMPAPDPTTPTEPPPAETSPPPSTAASDLPDPPDVAAKKMADMTDEEIEAYEEEHHAIPDASPVEVLRALMEANDLRQKDLAPIFGSESILSEILHNKRALNKAHIQKLSERFHVSPAVFF